MKLFIRLFKIFLPMIIVSIIMILIIVFACWLGYQGIQEIKKEGLKNILHEYWEGEKYESTQ